jgi:membrane-associated protein
MTAYAASFDTQFSSLAPFVLYVLIGAIVFIETGLLFGFFLPGDSILFSAGLVAAAHGDVNIVILVSIIVAAAFFGDQVGFVLGRVIGRPYLDRRQSPRIKAMVVNAERFYEKTGWWAVITARFFPWVRTFVPPIAGASMMNYYKFLSANIIGAILWGAGITLAGYYAYSIPWVKNFSYGIAAFFIVASAISVFVNYSRRPR